MRAAVQEGEHGHGEPGDARERDTHTLRCGRPQGEEGGCLVGVSPTHLMFIVSFRHREGS